MDNIINQQLREALESAKKRHEQLENELEHASSDIAKVIEINRELKRLTPIVAKFSELTSAANDIRTALEMIETESDEAMLAMARSELTSNQERIIALQAECQQLLLPRDPNDDKNIIVEMRPAAGGDEAAIFVGDLFACYKTFSDEMGWKLIVNEAKLSAQGGYDLIIFSISGESVYSYMRFESGVHRVQRVPATEAKGRVHTSTITVVVLPEMDELDVKIDSKDLRIDVMRASGAGGQSVNRTESAVRIVHLPTSIMVYCQEGKSQNENKATAMRVLRAKLWEKAELEREQEMSSLRRGQIGSGDRSEKIRTYNYPQNRVTDHRIGLSLNSLHKIMGGELMPLIEALQNERQRSLMESIAVQAI